MRRLTQYRRGMEEPIFVKLQSQSGDGYVDWLVRVEHVASVRAE
jgi:hypothetical protein